MYPCKFAHWLFQSTLPARGATALRRTAHRRSSRFQSTLPARGATNWCLSLTGQPFPFQSTLPARGATIYTHDDGTIVVISIHAPRTGSDLFGSLRSPHSSGFQSTLPARGATYNKGKSDKSDLFQSTLPARGATPGYIVRIGRYKFQSTLPARGATGVHPAVPLTACISIHAPRTGSDPPADRPPPEQ